MAAQTHFINVFHSFFPATCFRLTFRHNFDLEASDLDLNLGFDGGVLEISTDGGNTFQDILAFGGSFVMGGYNRTIAADREAPYLWSSDCAGLNGAERRPRLVAAGLVRV